MAQASQIEVTTALRERLETLEETYQATLNILEDFDQERGKLQLAQKAALNLLEDFDEERSRFQLIQKATLNLLEDFDEERSRFQLIQKATLNLLEDMNDERIRQSQTQRAVMNILEDIEGERVRTEQSRALLEVVNRELEAFSYSVSHDLRAPLRAISGYVAALMEDCAPQLDEEGQRFLLMVQDNAHKMGQLIDDLLTFSRLGRQEMSHTEIDLCSLARDVFNELSALSSERRIEFASDGAMIPPAFGDRNLLRQVLFNLLSNAIKFSKTRDVARVEFGYSPETAGGAYYVKDNGVGFDMRYVGKLFGVFQRLHGVTEFEGTGVGLALVSRIVTRHGGKAWAQSELDRGATFFFTLPRGEMR